MVGFSSRRQPRRKHVGPPTVGEPERSDLPPDRPPRAPRRAAADAPAPRVTGPRCIALFGPKSGTSTLAQVLAETAETPVLIVEAGVKTITAIIEEAEQAMQRAAVVFIDGAPRDASDAEALIASRVIDPGVDGSFVRIWAPDVTLIERGMTPDDIKSWRGRVAGIEDAVRRHAYPYFMIPNQPETGQDELLGAAVQLTKRAGIKK